VSAPNSPARDHRRFRPLVLVALLFTATVVTTAAPPKTTSRERKTEEGYQLVPGPEFSIQIKLIETISRGDKQPNLYIYDYLVTDNATGKIHGGRGQNRLEASVADMHLPARWQFKDLDGDGNIDFRYYMGDGQDHFWWAAVWQAKNRRFLFAKDYAGEK
jgi:hypothetical protein